MLLMGSAKGLEEKGSRGRFVRTGDQIILMNSSDLVISLAEGVGGRTATLVHKDRAAIGSEVWQVEWSGSQPVPQWLTRRPYLRCLLLERAVSNEHVYECIYVVFYLQLTFLPSYCFADAVDLIC
jgi:hypothetical protein